MQNNYYPRLVQFTLLLAIVVIVLGAYTRLSNAGLGCPDWPGCYGFLAVPNANQVPPELGLLDTEKAWKEMIHRYVAGSLGLLILIIFISSLCLKAYRSTRILSSLLLILVLFQATLGMLTVTMSLQPLIVVAHLLGGFLVLNLIWLLLLNLNNQNANQRSSINMTFVVSLLLIFLLLSQIALGGWLSANYAASFCNELPFCDGFNSDYSWQQFSFDSIWQLPVSSHYEFGVLPAQARLSIHLFHRFWAIVTTLMVFTFIISVYLSNVDLHIKNCALWVALLMISQVLLGVMMVFWHFPLLMALAHNLCAALLLMSLIRLSYALSKNSNNNVQAQ
ncbi:COX15/CtaA family protein [Psychromonas hadalis]|uniref:COX15/CtaA family protein n=1 Tax=Psychromonas hadalis TaxID=211669 RepID=UPI0003B3FCCA|nr:COX15/CtaA family protein [Psychromonas hadalis]